MHEGDGLPGGIDRIIAPRERDIGGFSVRRILPHAGRRTVGPFIFFDEMGPKDFAPGQGIDVRPHPHIGLATVTYLFEGEILHRDSLGYVQAIRPGDVNWMTAGHGIVHSERSGPEARKTGGRLHGIQSWVALPRESEETEPGFHHHPADTLPTVERDGVRMRVIAGAAFGATSPVATASPMFYADAALAADAMLALPDALGERAAYVVEGDVSAQDRVIAPHQMVVFEDGAAAAVQARGRARVMLLGGAALAEPRHIWWNFVSSRPERIEQAKADWRAERFGRVPGDDERIPLPDG